MRPFKECHDGQGKLSHPDEADEGRYFRANGHEYGRWPEEGLTRSPERHEARPPGASVALTPSTVCTA